LFPAGRGSRGLNQLPSKSQGDARRVETFARPKFVWVYYSFKAVFFRGLTPNNTAISERPRFWVGFTAMLEDLLQADTFFGMLFVKGRISFAVSMISFLPTH